MTRHPVSRLFASAIICVLLTPPVWADEKFARKIRRAKDVYQELLAAPDRRVPEELLGKANCIAIIPKVIKGAIGWGGRHGRGVLSCKTRGSWSPPAFVKLTGGSVGFQIGGESTDFVLFLMTRRSIESLLESKFTFGADISIAAGPVGRSAEASTDIRLDAEIYSYAKSKGLFAGASLEGSRLAADQKAIRQYYGQRIWPEDILFEHRVPRFPAEAKALTEALP